MLLPLFIAALISAAPTQKVRILPPTHKKAVDSWVSANPGFRIAKESDCGDCEEQIQMIRRGFGGAWKAVPNYDPYYAVGDFNSDGKTDFAIAVIASKRTDKRFRILVFNGPFDDSLDHQPAFVSEFMKLTGQGLFFGPPRPKPYRLLVGAFESEGILLVPKGHGYVWDRSENDY
jgi:hypothetical protein